MNGTAATMGIEENLALARRRGKSRFLRSGITKQEREEYRELLKVLSLGLEDRLTSRSAFSPGTAPGTDPSYGYAPETKAPSSG